MHRSTTRVRKHRTAEQRQKILSDYQSSGLTQRECASQAGIALSTLHRWLRKPANPRRFIRLPNVLAGAGPAAPYRLHLGGGRILDIGSGFRAEELAVLLPLLRQI
jgi:transcriptional regulator with XRE-family HTH domain